LIAGRGEYTKNKPPEEFEFDQVQTNKQKISNKARVIKFDTDIIGAQVWNGIHYETIKSDMSFVNEGIVKKLGLDAYGTNLLNNKNDRIKSYNTNASCFNISEYNTKSIEIQKNNLLSLNDITNLSLDFFVNSFIKNKNVFSVQVPAIYPDINKPLLDSFHGGSSITGVSDSILFCTHKNIYSENNNIKLIQTNSDDNSPTQISLNQSGNILLDGHKILIGSFNRLKEKQHGKSAMVYLGHSNENQSLVLGERLNDFLEELLTVQIETLNLTKDLFKKSKDVSSSTKDTLKNLNGYIKEFAGALDKATKAPPLIPLNAPFNAFFKIVEENEKSIEGIPIDEFDKQIIDFRVNKDEEYSLRIQSIVDNLELLLSKFTKTS